MKTGQATGLPETICHACGELKKQPPGSSMHKKHANFIWKYKLKPYIESASNNGRLKLCLASLSRHGSMPIFLKGSGSHDGAQPTTIFQLMPEGKRKIFVNACSQHYLKAIIFQLQNIWKCIDWRLCWWSSLFIQQSNAACRFSIFLPTGSSIHCHLPLMLLSIINMKPAQYLTPVKRLIKRRAICCR